MRNLGWLLLFLVDGIGFLLAAHKLAYRHSFSPAS